MVVKQVTANDVDLNPILTYDFAANGNPEEAFSIDRYSGKIAIAKALDYERRSRYQLKIQVGHVFWQLSPCDDNFLFYRLSRQGSPQHILHALLSNASSSLAPTS